MIRLTDTEFETLVTFIKSQYGINLEKKRQLIESRMFSILSAKGFSTFSEYFTLLKRDEKEVVAMLNKLTTNHTYFLREKEHYDFLTNVILPEQAQSNRERNLRIWSAGCSSGEEAYTTIMVMKDFFGLQKWDYRILATDLSTNVIEKAQNNHYPPEALKNLPPTWERKYFTHEPQGTYTLREEVKKEVLFRRFNLMDPFRFPKQFDLIFCRNVMIYFDQETKNRLINKFYDVLKPGGYLFIGHSETVQREKSRFRYIKPSIYQK